MAVDAFVAFVEPFVGGALFLAASAAAAGDGRFGADEGRAEQRQTKFGFMAPFTAFALLDRFNGALFWFGQTGDAG